MWGNQWDLTHPTCWMKFAWFVWHWTYQMRILWLNNVERRSSNGFNNKNVEGMLSKGLLEIKLPSATSNRVQQPGWSNSSTYSICTLTLLNWTIRRMLDEILRLFDHVLKRPTFYLTMSTNWDYLGYLYLFICLFVCFVLFFNRHQLLLVYRLSFYLK